MQTQLLRPRFSIRTLLILFTLAAAACWWWVERPTIVAQRFVDAINRQDFNAAVAMGQSDLSLAMEVLTVRIVPEPMRIGGGSFQNASSPQTIPIEASTLPRNWHDFFSGQRRIELRQRSSDGTKRVVFAGPFYMRSQFTNQIPITVGK